MFINPLYIVLVGPFLLLAAWASWRVRSTFARFASVGVRSGMTGAQAAAAVSHLPPASAAAAESCAQS